MLLSSYNKKTEFRLGFLHNISYVKRRGNDYLAQWSFSDWKNCLVSFLHQEIYVPKCLGNFFTEKFPTSAYPEDFQDYPIWRRATSQIIRDLASKTDKIIIVAIMIFRQKIIE